MASKMWWYMKRLWSEGRGADGLFAAAHVYAFWWHIPKIEVPLKYLSGFVPLTIFVQEPRCRYSKESRTNV